MKKLLKVALWAGVIMVSAIGNAQQSVKDLSWMTGSWRGSLGPNTIEEIWMQPSANAMQASVRILAGENTSVHEFIVISKVGESLELNLQQWGPGYVSLAPVTKMKLIEMSDNSITFEADETASIKRLTYRRVDETTFQIAVTTKDAPEFVMTLKAVE